MHAADAERSASQVPSPARLVALARKERLACDTYAFAFEKPAGFKFEAGQAIDLTLPGPATRDERDMRRTFSIASAPCESELVVATRIRDSAFKHELETLKTGAHVRMDGPFGSLLLHDNLSRPAVFIAGGIGITPFISMLRQAAYERREQVLALLYSNRRPDDAAFLGELLNYEQHHRGTFRMRATVTTPPPNGVAWPGDCGRIDARFVSSVIVPPSAPVFYVAGSASMVSGMQDLLREMRVPDADVRLESFSGY